LVELAGARKSNSATLNHFAKAPVDTCCSTSAAKEQLLAMANSNASLQAESKKPNIILTSAMISDTAMPAVMAAAAACPRPT
jgi:hypothetical protein